MIELEMHSLKRQPFLFCIYCFAISINETAASYPLNTGRKLNVYKTFSRRPGRLLNVLFTFNLRPVSRGLALSNLLRENNYFFSIQIEISVSIPMLSFQYRCGKTSSYRPADTGIDTEGSRGRHRPPFPGAKFFFLRKIGVDKKKRQKIT